MKHPTFAFVIVFLKGNPVITIGLGKERKREGTNLNGDFTD